MTTPATPHPTVPDPTGPGPSIAPRALGRAILPFALITFLAFFAISVPLPILPIFAHSDLRFGTAAVGVVVGLQPLTTLLTRQFAGRLCVRRGPKGTTQLGLAAAVAAGLLYGAATLPGGAWAGLACLAAGRVLLGVGESLFMTALSAWMIARVGAANAGRGMSWLGVAIYGAMGLGAPIGLALGHFGLCGLAAAAFPAVAMLVVARWRDAPSAARAPQPFRHALRAALVPGLAMALASIGTGTVTAFLALRFQDAQWSHAGAALLAYGAANIVMRLGFGSLPDRWGYRAALLSLGAQAAGLAAVWFAPSPLAAIAGIVVAGIGYSLVFPALGVEALRNGRGTDTAQVLGAYFACFDVGLALSGPVAGAAIQWRGPPAAFAAAALAAFAGFVLVGFAMRRPRRAEPAERPPPT